MPTTVQSVVRYLGLRSADRPIALLDPQLDASIIGALVERYRPAVVVGPVDATPGRDADGL